MKKHLLLFIGLVLAEISFSQGNNSVLTEGNWFKFEVDTTGVFRIDRSFLQQLGISTNGLNPKKIHIYGNGGALLAENNSDFRYDDLQENAIFIAGESDNSFDTNDFILFYAKGPHDWKINATKSTATHRQNPFSDKAYYFITVNTIDGKRITSKTPVTSTASSQITVFDDFTFFEKDERNLFVAGMQWFFTTDFNIENTQTFTFLLRTQYQIQC